MNIRSCCLMLLIVLIVPACVPAPTPTRKDWMYSDIMVGFIQAGSEGEWRTANTASFKETAQQLGITLNFYDDRTHVRLVTMGGEPNRGFPRLYPGSGCERHRSRRA